MNEESSVDLATEDTDARLRDWQQQMEQSTLFTDDSNRDAGLILIPHITEGAVLPLSDLWEKMNQRKSETLMTIDDETKAVMTNDVNILNDDQRHAYITSLIGI